MRVITILLFSAIAVNAGTIQMGTPDIKQNEVIVPVFLQGDVGSGVAALDFTLEYDPAILNPNGATAGQAATAAQKNVEVNVKKPGEYVVMMFGLNQTTVQAGKIAEIRMDRVGGEEAETMLAISGATMASMAGETLDSEGSTALIQLGAMNNNPSDTDPEETPPTTPTSNPEPEEQPQGTGSGGGATPDTSAIDSSDLAPVAAIPIGVPSMAPNPTDASNVTKSRLARLEDAARALDASRSGLPENASRKLDNSGSADTRDGNNPLSTPPSQLIAPTASNGAPGNITTSTPGHLPPTMLAQSETTPDTGLIKEGSPSAVPGLRWGTVTLAAIGIAIIGGLGATWAIVAVIRQRRGPRE